MRRLILAATLAASLPAGAMAQQAGTYAVVATVTDDNHQGGASASIRARRRGVAGSAAR